MFHGFDLSELNSVIFVGELREREIAEELFLLVCKHKQKELS